MKFKILYIIIIFASTSVYAEDRALAKSDTFDLSQYNQKIKELGIPTVPKVLALERKGMELYAAKDWKAAAVASAEYVKQADWLLNFMDASLKPFNRAYSEAHIYGNLGAAITNIQGQMKELRLKRNCAMVVQAECEINAGDKEKGLGTLLHALDLMDITDTPCWEKAQKMLCSMTEIK
jgi:hypothetical protein